MGDLPQITEMMLGKFTGKGEQEGQKLHYPVPSLLVFGLVWNIRGQCHFCRVLFVGRNAVSVCPVIHLHLHLEHRDKGLLISLNAPGRNTLMVRHVAVQSAFSPVEKDTMIWRTVSPQTRSSSPLQRESSVRCKWREQDGSVHWLWTTECAALLLYEVNLSISDWRQILNRLIALWLDLARQTMEAKCDRGEGKNTSNTAKKRRLVIVCWHAGICTDVQLNLHIP